MAARSNFGMRRTRPHGARPPCPLILKKTTVAVSCASFSRKCQHTDALPSARPFHGTRSGRPWQPTHPRPTDTCRQQRRGDALTHPATAPYRRPQRHPQPAAPPPTTSPEKPSARVARQARCPGTGSQYRKVCFPVRASDAVAPCRRMMATVSVTAWSAGHACRHPSARRARLAIAPG